MGWSEGGLLAFEVGRQLLVRGDSVGSLSIIDSSFSFSTALDRLDLVPTVSEELHANYNPPPLPHPLLRSTQLNLFKSLEELDSPLSKYYVNETEYNHLDTLVPPETISLHTISNHMTWLKNSTDLDTVSAVLLRSLNSTTNA
jgi:thioesterase domain-containing protein